MKIESKFLTAEAEVVSIRLEGREIVLEGRVKGFLPMVIRVGPEDARTLLKALVQSARTAVARKLGKTTDPPT